MISSHIENQQLFIQVKGSLTVDVFHEFETAYLNKNIKHVLIDFSACHHIDSGGLGMLLQLRERMGSDPSKITLKNLSADILKVFEVVKFEKLFTVA